ncbi:uncharacterized protein [Eucyclogobius newberryi]|uniref:uncharacterized protein n=1 Tax=Eucyclogobius newberryi TaxID=166745 RepID=UPI003B5A5882
MSSLQLTVALLCLFSLLSLTSGAWDDQTRARIKRDVDVLARRKQELSKRYWSSHDFTSKVLDKGLKLVDQMHDLMHEYDVEEEFPPVAEFVEDLKIFLEETKDFTKQQMDTMEEEYPHSLTASQPHCLTASQPHSLTASQPHSLTASQPHSLTASQPHSLTVSQPHSLTASQPHSLTASQSAVMSSLQLTVALLCLFSLLSLTSGAWDDQTWARIKRDVDVLAREKQELSKRYWSSHDFTSKVLDKGLKLVDQMHDLMHEYDVEEEFPPVAEFVEDLKIFLEETKDFTKQQMDTMEEEYVDKTVKIKALNRIL